MFDFVSLEIIMMATWVIAFWAVVHFSSEYMRRCFFSSPTLINDFPHSLHWCGLYPEWESKCKFLTRWISTFCTFVHFLPSVDIIVFLERRLDQMTSYNWSMCWLWLHCGWARAFTEYNLEQITSSSGHKCMLYCIAVGYNLPLQISCSTKWLLTF